IGRGARYYPFEYKEEQLFTRRFDKMSSALKIIEARHYHTINDNTYIKILEKSLEAANIQVKEDQYHRLEAKVKSQFKKQPIFKTGKIYINKLVETTAEDYNALNKYNVQTSYDIKFDTTIEQSNGI